jgi:hypothetical protein
MATPPSLLRVRKHLAHPQTTFCPFDDLEVHWLHACWLQHRSVFDVPALAKAALPIVSSLRASAQTSYARLVYAMNAACHV